MFLRLSVINVNQTTKHIEQNHFYIYIYAFSKCFYPKRLARHSGYTFFCQFVCSLGIEPTTFCAANTMLYFTFICLFICLFFYADLLAYKITPIIDSFFPNRVFQIIWCVFLCFCFFHHNIYRWNTKYRNVSFFQCHAALIPIKGPTGEIK